MDPIDVVLKVSAMVGGGLAVVTFLRTAKVRRAEWLSNLHADASSELVESFVDYLNFFNFVASLRKLRQLKPKEISMLFDYYLRLLRKHHFVRSYIRQQGFEELEALLKEDFKGGTW